MKPRTSSFLRVSLPLGLLVAGFGVAPSARAEALRVMTVEECIAVAEASGPEARAAEREVDGATASRAAAFGELLPRVRVEGNAILWDRPFDVVFAPEGAAAGPPIRVREGFTWSAQATVQQPVTGLFAIYDEYRVRDFGVDVARVKRDVARRDLAFRVAERYLRVLETTRLLEVATTSVTQLEAQRTRAKALFDQGIIGKNDLLRAELAVASAKERSIRGEGELALARGRLAAAMGLSPSVTVEPAPIADAPPNADGLTLASVETRAREQRLEIREVAARTAQADERVATARKKLLPQVHVIGNYTHAEGSAFSQTNAAYGGVTASWDVWDWGTNWHGIDVAAAQRDGVVLARLALERDLALEARQAFVGYQTARAALDVAESARTQAEENYRIVSRRFDAAEATSFDVVDAESLLTEARARSLTARYGAHLSRLALDRATGALTPSVR